MLILTIKKADNQLVSLVKPKKKKNNINFFLKYLGVLPEFAVSTDMLQKP